MGIFTAKKEIGPDTVLQRRNDLLFNEIDGEMVMLSIHNGEYYGMDKVGSRIWKILSEPIKLSCLVDKLILEYEINRDQCLIDTVNFLEKLHDKALIFYETIPDKQ